MIIENINEVIKHLKNPAKIAMAVVKDQQGKYNAITLEWFMRTSSKPPMYAISVAQSRYSYECLQQFRYFNLCFPSPELVEMTKICGTKSGRNTDKFALCNVDYFLGKLAKLPVLKKATATLECEIITQVRSGDHTIFVGEVKYAWYDPNSRVITYEDL